MNNVERNLTVFDAHCLTNGHAFEAYDFSDFEYGERIIRTTDGQDFALLAFDDPVVKELQKLLDAIYGGKLDEIERAKLFNRVFGSTCDPLNGKQLDASARFSCPICKSSEVRHWDFKPPRFRSFSIPLISHENWSAISPQQKRSLIEEGLRSKGLL
jgi:hypothetical protein